MKKTLILLFALFTMGGVIAQNFEHFFEEKTLRINYLRIGKNDMDSVVIADHFKGEGWYGTRENLIEEGRIGDIVLEVYDKATNTLILQKSYSSLFEEYTSTKRAETEVGKFEEVIVIPFPKNEILYKLTTYSRKNEPSLIYSGIFSPNQDGIIPFEKEFGTLDLHIGGKPENCIDILFIPDGYAKSDKKKLAQDMERFAGYIMECTPFKENKEKVNIRAIKGYSKESGITDPNGGVVRNTLINSSFNIIDLDRYLMCLNVWRMNEIADDAPYDVIVIVGNTKKYGGGGIYNFYCTVTNEGFQGDYVIVHELGHLIGGLGDEYYNSEVSVRDYYPEGVEPVERNLTTLTNFDVKWKSQLKEKTPVPTPNTQKYKGVLGVFEGGGYVAQGVYRPWLDCTMKEAVYNGFCPVCTKVLEESINIFSK